MGVSTPTVARELVILRANFYARARLVSHTRFLHADYIRGVEHFTRTCDRTATNIEP